VSIEKKPFVNYGKGSKPAIAIKLNDYDDLMISVGQYVFNMESKSGVVKKLAHIGLKVILTHLGAEEMHYFTNGERSRYIREKPDIEGYLQKGNHNKP